MHWKLSFSIPKDTPKKPKQNKARVNILFTLENFFKRCFSQTKLSNLKSQDAFIFFAFMCFVSLQEGTKSCIICKKKSLSVKKLIYLHHFIYRSDSFDWEGVIFRHHSEVQERHRAEQVNVTSSIKQQSSLQGRVNSIVGW